MKKKFLLMLAMVLVLTLAFAISVFADETASIHNGKVDPNATVTLGNGTVVNLFDSEGNALIWYKDSNGALASIRADDSRVKYVAGAYDVNIHGVKGAEMTNFKIVLDEGTIAASGIVVFNIMDDDVVTNECTNSKWLDKKVTCMKDAFKNSTNLEYAFLRLDTTATMASIFSNCKNLKYVNLEELTELRKIGGSAFNSCSSLFKGEVIDLTRTKLISIEGGGSFAGVPLSGVKFPSTFTSMGTWAFQSCPITEFAFPTTVNNIPNATFKSCKSLATIYINSTVLSIGDEAFRDASSLKTVFYIGTFSELNALLDNTSTSNNAPFWNVVGENRANLISYADYLKLEDKSGKYVVYGYSYCEAFSDGKHVLSGNAKMQAVDYFKGVFFADTCTVTGCGMGVVDETKTIGALFIDYGYSATEAPINGTYSMSQFYGINREAIEQYRSISEGFEFGFVVAANADPFGAVANGTLFEDKIFVTEEKFFAYDYAFISIGGITTETADKAVAFCVFVNDGEKIYYLDGGKTVDTVAIKSYNDIVNK